MGFATLAKSNTAGSFEEIRFFTHRHMSIEYGDLFSYFIKKLVYRQNHEF